MMPTFMQDFIIWQKKKGALKSEPYADFDSPVRSIAFVPGKNEFFASDSNGKVLKWDLE